MTLAPLRSDIEKALDELATNEEGMRFQSLAVVLAKQRWPELVASERKNDLGLDAYVIGSHASDGVGRGLACSITATYAKVADDAEKVGKHFGVQIQRLVFATSGKIGTPKKLEWAEKIRKDCGLELEVISREDIVSSLADPRNLGLCRTYLRLDVKIDPSLADLAHSIRTAARDELGNWATRVAGQALIELQANSVEANGADRADAWSIADIGAALGEARRLVLEAPAGCGKTTTLIQLAQGQLSEQASVFFVDLPLWAKSGRDILPYITGMAAFQRQGLTSEQLARSESVEQFHFLLNGWNEISASHISDAELLVRDLERQFPSAGILVATRAHYVTPPVPGATRLRLRRVGRLARSTYIRERLGEAATGLLTAIKTDQTLDDLTRTPFVLSEVTSIVAAGGRIPRSRIGVIEAAVLLQERSTEHAGALRSAPVGGMSARFLEALAMRMIPKGAVSLAEDEARSVVHEVSDTLAVDGQLLPHSAPTDILNTLCAHHVLERFEYPEHGYRFAHQLFEEYYAFRALERRFEIVMTDTQAADNSAAFVRDILNRPAWTEPVQMLAESLYDAELKLGSNARRDSANALVTLALAVAPVFACHLASMLGVRSTDSVAHALTSRLRDWYASTDDHHRQCALAGMLASGLDTFRDIIEPLLSGDDDQSTLRVYRLWPAIRVSSFGPHWQDVVRAWSEKARVTFVSEILRYRFAAEVSAFALADSSLGVKAAAMEALLWLGAEEEVVRASQELDDATFLSVFAGTSHDLVPISLRPRTLQLLRDSLKGVTGHATRVRVLLHLQELGDSAAIADLKSTLELLSVEQFRDLSQYIVAPLLDALRANDADWTGQWVARRIAEGALWSEWWSKYLTVIPNELREEQFARLTEQHLEHRDISTSIAILSRDARPELARRAFQHVLEVWQVIRASGRPPALVFEVLRQVEALLRAIAPATVISGISGLLSAVPTREVIEAFVHVYGRTAGLDTGVMDLDGPSRALVLGYLKNGLPLVLEQDDFAGEVKAEFASVLSQVGEPADIGDLMTVVRADIKRVRDGRAARIRAERTAASDGAVMNWTHAYVGAIVALLRGDADEILLSLFGEPEYERSLLEEYARQFGGAERRDLGRRPQFNQIWLARAQRVHLVQNEARRARVAEMIHARIRHLKEKRDSDADRKYLNGRLKMLALGLADVAPRQYADEIIELLSLPAEFDAHTCVDALERLLFAGMSLPSDKVLPLLDCSLDRMRKWGMQDHDRWVIVRFLRICPFVDDPTAGLQKIRHVISQAHLHLYDLRDLLPALGHSKFDGALPLMLEWVSLKQAWQAIEHEWISALADLDTEDASRTMLGFVDPELPGLPFALDWSSGELAASRIAQIAAQNANVDLRLRELSLLSLDEPRRQLLAQALALRGTGEAQLAGLNLLDDGRQPQVPPGVRNSIENTFIEEQVHPIYANARVRQPSASNPIRAKLYAMIFEDEKRQLSAYSLIGQIEEWRLEYGRPIEEPRHPALDLRRPWPPPEPA